MENNVPTYISTSFGNMGFSKTVCSKDLLEFGGKLALISLDFQCEKTTHISEVIDSGVLLSHKLDLGSDNVLATCDSNHYTKDSISEQYTNSEYFKRKPFQDLIY